MPKRMRERESARERIDASIFQFEELVFVILQCAAHSVHLYNHVRNEQQNSSTKSTKTHSFELNWLPSNEIVIKVGTNNIQERAESVREVDLYTTCPSSMQPLILPFCCIENKSLFVFHVSFLTNKPAILCCCLLVCLFCFNLTNHPM